ncbi:unnamed protein product [Protopolystoma xenopodis]|uniref:Uncharacterized protein n=1 Tax=Protopolystoma xenopodis TaxID=117903 RepID=A0A448WFB7_9PLAT|nr:unnamed protein product [Protopolystoma xenopodis]
MQRPPLPQIAPAPMVPSSATSSLPPLPPTRRAQSRTLIKTSHENVLYNVPTTSLPPEDTQSVLSVDGLSMMKTHKVDPKLNDPSEYTNTLPPPILNSIRLTRGSTFSLTTSVASGPEDGDTASSGRAEEKRARTRLGRSRLRRTGASRLESPDGSRGERSRSSSLFSRLKHSLSSKKSKASTLDLNTCHSAVTISATSPTNLSNAPSKNLRRAHSFSVPPRLASRRLESRSSLDTPVRRSAFSVSSTSASSRRLLARYKFTALVSMLRRNRPGGCRSNSLLSVGRRSNNPSPGWSRWNQMRQDLVARQREARLVFRHPTSADSRRARRSDSPMRSGAKNSVCIIGGGGSPQDPRDFAGGTLIRRRFGPGSLISQSNMHLTPSLTPSIETASSVCHSTTSPAHNPSTLTDRGPVSVSFRRATLLNTLQAPVPSSTRLADEVEVTPLGPQNQPRISLVTKWTRNSRPLRSLRQRAGLELESKTSLPNEEILLESPPKLRLPAGGDSDRPCRFIAPLRSLISRDRLLRASKRSRLSALVCTSPFSATLLPGQLNNSSPAGNGTAPDRGQATSFLRPE